MIEKRDYHNSCVENLRNFRREGFGKQQNPYARPDQRRPHHLVPYLVDGAGGRLLWLRFLLVVIVVGWNESSICPMNLKALTIFLSLSNTTAFTPRRAFGADYTASALVPKKCQALYTKN